jgi:nicotinamidase-related amidase
MVADRLDPQHTCLLFFDTSKSVVNGPTLRREDRRPERESIVANWQRQLALARELGMMIAYAQTAQRPDGANYFPRLMDLDDEDKPFPIGERRPMSANVLGSERVQAIEEIAPRPEDYIFWKERWDPLAGHQLRAIAPQAGNRYDHRQRRRYRYRHRGDGLRGAPPRL